MADEPVIPAAVPAAAAPVAPTQPAAVTPNAPAVAASATPSPEAGAVVSPSAAPELPLSAPAVEARPAEPAPSSLLSDAKTSEAKPAEAAPAAEAKPAEAPAPAVPPAYEPFTLPEGVKLDEEGIGKLTALLGEAELATKADHTAMQAMGQKLVDMYVAEVQRISEGQQQAWIRARDEWRNKFIADPDIGGARRESTLRNCASMIEQFGGNAEQQAELRQAFGITGMGDHPAMIRFINNMASVLSEGKPVPATSRSSPVPASKSQRRYANTLNGAN